MRYDLEQNYEDVNGSLISLRTAISDFQLYGKIMWYSGSINISTRDCTFQSRSVPVFARKRFLKK